MLINLELRMFFFFFLLSLHYVLEHRVRKILTFKYTYSAWYIMPKLKRKQAERVTSAVVVVFDAVARLEGGERISDDLSQESVQVGLVYTILKG